LYRNAVSAAIGYLRLRWVDLGGDDIEYDAPEHMRILSRISGSDNAMVPSTTPLHDSIMNLDKSLPLELALAADPTAINDFDETGQTPLHWAIDVGNEAAVDFLLAHGANIRIPDQFGYLPLDNAVWGQNGTSTGASIRIVNALIRAGYDVNHRDSVHGMTAIHYATAPMIKVLLGLGADPTVRDGVSWTVLHYLVQNWQPHKTGENFEEFKEVVRILLAAGADINATSSCDETPLLLCIYRRGRGHQSDQLSTNMLAYLHQNGANLDIVDSDGMTILHYASRYAALGTIEYLRSLNLVGIDPDKNDKQENTAVEDLLWLLDSENELRLYERRPTRAEALSCMALITEVRERNWEQGLFLDSKQDPEMWEWHLVQKEGVEKLWRQLVEFRREDDCESVSEDGSEESIDDSNEEDGSGSNDRSYDDGGWHHGLEFQLAMPRWLRDDQPRKAQQQHPNKVSDIAGHSDHSSGEESDAEDNAFFDALDGME